MTWALGQERIVAIERLAAEPGTILPGGKMGRTQLFTAALVTLTAQYGGVREVTVGVPFHRRLTPADQDIPGLLMEVIPVHVSLEKGDTTRTLLQKVGQAYAEGMLGVVRGGGSFPPHAFEVLFNDPAVRMNRFAGFRVRPRWLHPGAGDGYRYLLAQLDDFAGTGHAMLHVDARTDLFDEARHRLVGEQVVHLLDQMLARPEDRIDELDLMPSRERERVLIQFNRTPPLPAPPFLNVAALVTRVADRDPHTPALWYQGTGWTYAELEHGANQMARCLKRRGVRPGTPVALLARPSPSAMMALLAIFKAGATYLPLDPGYPARRLAYMIDDARPVLVVTGPEENVGDLPPGVRVLPIDELAAGAVTEPVTPPVLAEVRPDDTAYLIYTSGSTGHPKGVAMPHRALTNLVWWQINQATRLRRPRTLQYTPLSFDVSLQEIFACWGAGGTLVLAPPGLRHDPTATLAYLDRERIEQLFIIYTPLRKLAETAVRLGRYPGALREVITCGEPVRIHPPLRTFFEQISGCTLQNQYGPSETHIVTWYELDGPPAAWPEWPSIGRPIPNTHMYVLDEHRRPVPTGMQGELYVGGEAVATGYLNRPEITKERFVPDPFTGKPGATMYKTGDMVRFEADGTITFLGRVDHQVKLRGFRVELGEIETALRELPGVMEAAVVVQGAGGEDAVLAAFVEGRGVAERQLRGALKNRLPDYMVPGVIRVCATLPRTPNGKVDRQALVKERNPGARRETPFVPPRGETEQMLASLFEQVLGQGPVGRHDDFFALGGHSLRAMTLVDRLEHRTGQRIPVATMYEAPTVEQLARHLSGSIRHARGPHLVPLRVEVDGPPLFCVHNLAGHVWLYGALAYHLKDRYRVYGLQGEGLDGRPVGFARVEEMAERYLEEIRPIQPHGPYHLVGYCLGSRLAFAMAARLVAQGESVGLLASIDGVGPTLAARILRSGVVEGHEIDEPDSASAPARRTLHERVGSRLRKLQRHGLARWACLRAGVGLGVPGYARNAYLMRVYRRLFLDYRPEPIPVHMMLFRSTPLQRYEKDLGWRPWCLKGVTTCDIEGPHRLLDDPYAAGLARSIHTSLAAGR